MTNPIGALFGRSPIRPIEQHMSKSQQCVVLLGDLLTASMKQDWAQAAAHAKAIIEGEQDADEMKRDIQSHLPRSLFLPFARADLLELLRLQDQLANHSKSAARMIISRKMTIPDALQDCVGTYYTSTLEISGRTKQAIHELDELLETGFRGKEAELVDRMIGSLDELEKQCEANELALKARLFELESELPPVDVMFLYKLTDKLSEITGTSLRIGAQILLLMAN